jgi:outer membrane protein assembly factor BamB
MRSFRWTTGIVCFLKPYALRGALGLLGGGLLLGPTPHVRGDDWPQWMGPNRDNVFREKGIIDAIPKDGLKTVWTSKVGGGYSGPAVASGKVVVTDFVTGDDVKVDNFNRGTFSGKERILCLDEATGKQLWKHEHPVTYTVSYPAGPRCTPVIDGDHAYTLGTEGNLFCFNLKDGTIVWQSDFKQAYGAKAALWGWASHPLIDGDKLICIVGGDGSHAVAFNKKTGDEIWKSGSATEQGYSPPVIIEAGGKRQLILIGANVIRSADPDTGIEYWSHPYEATNGSVIMTPLQWKEYLYLGGYSDKNMLLKLGTDSPTAEVVWQDERKKAISPVNVQPYVDNGVIFGMDQSGEFMAVDFVSGDRLWKTPWPLSKDRPAGSGTAFIIRHEDHCFLFADNGELVLAKIDAKGHKEIGRTQLIKPTNNAFNRPVVWCAPALANGNMYVRNDEELICVSLKK